MRPLVLLALCLAPSLSAAEDTCLPKVSMRASWTACRVDGDCVLAGDGCRTCAHFLPVNRAYRDAATKKDQRARSAARCAMTCEACAPAAVTLRCEAGQCRASRASQP